MSKGKIILPGGAGLVGQNLVPRLKDRGYSDIVVLDKHAHNLQVLKQCHPDVVCELADLSLEGLWQSRFEGASAVVMLQAQIGGLDADEFTRNNENATRNVLSAMQAHGVTQLVHISSSVVASVGDDLYTRSKKRQEQMVLDSGFSCPILRPTLMFGWFDRKHLGWLSRFMQRVPVFPVPGSGRYMRQPLYAGDFCNIIISCLERPDIRGVFNISGQERIDYIDLIRAVKKATGAGALILRIPYALFHFLLWVWSLFDRNPPFTTEQLAALTAGDEFEVIDWPTIFGVSSTPLATALDETFNHPQYSKIALEF
ncbi:NAD(P)-dependent oxidoreductase [Halieaceae bacterium]|nr:NAD(P)-dependent oxidoreductase [Halieaceae bacterium]